MHSPILDRSPQDVEIERNELLRLMKTAKDDERKAIIRESLLNLENSAESPPVRKKSSAALLAARHNNIFETEKISSEASFLKSSPKRPASARRVSLNNLSSIKEEKTHSLSEIMGNGTRNSLTDISFDDVNEIVSSCCDPRLSKWNPFSKPSSSSWVSTGMTPQFISIGLKMNWQIKEVCMKCEGLISGSIGIVGSLTRFPLRKENSTTFSYHSNHSNDRKSRELLGDRIVITLEESSEIFVVVESVYIKAIPYASG